MGRLGSIAKQWSRAFLSGAILTLSLNAAVAEYKGDDYAIAYCAAKKILTLGKASYSYAARKAAERLCIRKGGSAKCCESRNATYPRSVRHRYGPTLCIAAVRGPNGIMGFSQGGNRSKETAIKGAVDHCAQQIAEDGSKECKPYRVMIVQCRPPIDL